MNTGVRVKPETKLIFFFFLIALIGLWIRTLFFGWVWDDHATLVLNQSFKSHHAWRDIWFYDFWGLHFQSASSGYWRPLSSLAYLLVYSVVGLEVWAFHGLNVLLHLGATGLTYLISEPFLKHKTQRAWLSLLFFTLGVHVETVAFVSALPDLLSACLGFFAIYGYQLLLQGRFKAPALYLTIGLALLGSALSKETGICFTVLVLGMALKSDQTDRHGRSRLIIFLGVLVFLAYFIARFYFYASSVEKSLLDTFSWPRLSALSLFFQAQANIIFPIQLLPLKEVWVKSGWLATLVGVAAMFFTYLVYFSRRIPRLRMALVMMGVLWLPYMGWVELKLPISDRYHYSFAFAYLLFIFTALSHLLDAEAKKLRMMMLGGFFALQFTMAAQAVSHWRSDEKLWASIPASSPHYAVALNHLGLVKADRSDYQNAGDLFFEAHKHDPSYREASFNWCWAQLKIEKYLTAERCVSGHLHTFPQDASGYDLLSLAQLKLGQIEKAKDSLERAIGLDPRIWTFRYNLALLYVDRGQWDRAAWVIENAPQPLYTAGPKIWLLLIQMKLNQAQWQGAKMLCDRYEDQMENTAKDACDKTRRIMDLINE